MISYLKHSGQVGRFLSAGSSTSDPSSVRSKSPKFSKRSIFEKWLTSTEIVVLTSDKNITSYEKNVTYVNKFHHPQISTSINKLEVGGWQIKTSKMNLENKSKNCVFLPEVIFYEIWSGDLPFCVCRWGQRWPSGRCSSTKCTSPPWAASLRLSGLEASIRLSMVMSWSGLLFFT